MDLSKFAEDYARSSEQQRPVEVQQVDGQFRTVARGLITEAGAPALPNLSGLAFRRAGFTIASNDVRPTDVVSINGDEWSVEVAETQGLIARDGGGSFKITKTPDQIAKDYSDAGREEEAKRKSDEPTSWMNPNDDAAIGRMFHQGGDEVAAVANKIAEGEEPNEAALSAAASRLGVEPEKFVGAVEGAKKAYMTDAVGMTDAKYGYTPEVIKDAFYYAADKGLGRDLMSQHLSSGKADYGPLVEAHQLHTVEADPGAWLEAECPKGYSVERGQDGALVLNTPDGPVGLEAAIRMRRIAMRRTA